jgi:hypothetical protein
MITRSIAFVCYCEIKLMYHVWHSACLLAGVPLRDYSPPKSNLDSWSLIKGIFFINVLLARLEFASEFLNSGLAFLSTVAGSWA